MPAPPPDPALDRDTLDYLHRRLGEAYTAERLAREKRHHSEVLHWHSKIFHLENWSAAHRFIRWSLTLSGLLRRGQANARRLQLRRNRLALPCLPANFEGFRILHLSDLHLDMDRETTHNLIAAVREVDYDVCVMTGDYRANTCGDSEPAMALMAQLHAHLKSSVYAVLGNHDSIVSVAKMEGLGIRLLMNESAVIERDGHSIGIAGVDDGHYFQLDDADKALAGIADQPLKLLLSHTPETYRSAAAAGADVFFCGHTHGGQICLPGGVPVILESRCPRSLGKGAWRFQQMQGYTSAGASTSVVNVRLNCPPEITLHELRSS